MILKVAFCLGTIVGGLFAGRTVQAQVPNDTLSHYELGEIVVGPQGSSTEASSVSTTQRVRLADIAQTDVASIDYVLRLVPSAHLQTNSRGESLIYLRGSGERQVSIFFDGALLNVPWDNRIDLSLIPSEVVGEISIAKGVPSVLYGANVLGGAINLTSRQLSNQGAFTQLSGITGSYGSQQARLTWLRRTERFQSTVFAGLSDQNGIGVPDEADLPYSQHSDVRTNTDRRMQSVFGQVAYNVGGGGSIGISLLSLGGKKGVAPEGHLDPEVSRVRFWRYPEWETNMAIVSGQFPIRNGTLRGAAWVSRFGQTIAQYSNASYGERLSTQIDQDDTYGLRLTYLRDFSGKGVLRTAVNWLSSSHEQQDLAIGEIPLLRLFSQRVLSNGIEYTKTGRVNVTVGASMDVFATPKTGDKPDRGPQTGIGVTVGLSHELTPGVTIRGVAGRKVRFPTMRELFGEALGRFLVNPDLVPESSLLTEVAVRIERSETTAEAIVFLNRTHNTIGQRMVLAEGETRPRRQRVNLDGGRILGLEATLVSRIMSSILASCSMTVMRARAVTTNGTEPLVEKPSGVGGCRLSYRSTSGFSVVLEEQYTGEAHGLAQNNEFVTLEPSLVTNIRLAWLILYKQYSAEIFARGNNITDAVTLPQLGLPGPGRAIHGGVQVTF